MNEWPSRANSCKVFFGDPLPQNDSGSAISSELVLIFTPGLLLSSVPWLSLFAPTPLKSTRFVMEIRSLWLLKSRLFFLSSGREERILVRYCVLRSSYGYLGVLIYSETTAWPLASSYGPYDDVTATERSPGK